MMLSGTVLIHGQTGDFTCRWDGQFLRCVDCACFIDANGYNIEKALLDMAEYHVPHWFGFAKYTIKPKRPVGRRVA